jgi:hypothetical protein
MIKLAIIDPGAEDIAGRIIAALHEYGGDSLDVGVCRFDTISAMRGICPDVLVLSPDTVGKKEAPAAKERVACGIALIPGDTGPGDAGSSIEAECVVTYGMSPKNTLTLSSISEASYVLAIQRELLTAKGDVLDRQEIRMRGGMKPDTLMAVAGTLLICGVKVPDINV